MSIVKTGESYFKLKNVVEFNEPIKDQVARVGKVGVMLTRQPLEKPELRLDIYEEINSNIVGASTLVWVLGTDMDHYHIDNKYVRLLASSKLHDAIKEALIYYRYEHDEYYAELDAIKPLNVLKNFCKEAEIPLVSIISLTLSKLRSKGLSTARYTKEQSVKYTQEIRKLQGNDFFTNVAKLMQINTQDAESKYAEGVLAFWLFNHLEMDATSIDASFEWEDGKASELLKNHIFFILDIHRAIENIITK